jgi:hypothetical protein
MQPRAERLRLADRASPTSKHEEHSLRRVHGLLAGPQDVETDSKDHWAVPLNDGSEGSLCRLVRSGEELSEQLLVGQHDD